MTLYDSGCYTKGGFYWTVSLYRPWESGWFSWSVGDGEKRKIDVLVCGVWIHRQSAIKDEAEETR